MIRTDESLAALPHATLVAIISELYNERREVNAIRVVDAAMSVAQPLPEWTRSNVMLSPDLLSRIFNFLHVDDFSAALVCSTWAAEWRGRTWGVFSLRSSISGMTNVNGAHGLPDGTLLVMHQGASSGDTAILSMFAQDNETLVRRDELPLLRWPVCLAMASSSLFMAGHTGIVKVPIANGTLAASSSAELVWSPEAGVDESVSGICLCGDYLYYLVWNDMLGKHSLERQCLLPGPVIPWTSRVLEAFEDCSEITSHNDLLYVSACDTYGASIILKLAADGELLDTFNGPWNEICSMRVMHERLYMTETPPDDEDSPDFHEGFQYLWELNLQDGKVMQKTVVRGAEFLTYTGPWGEDLVTTCYRTGKVFRLTRH